MTIQDFISEYSDLCVATSYVLGFTYKKQVYMVKSDRLSADYMILDHASSKNGGDQSLRVYFNTGSALKAIASGAECIGSEDILKDGKYNKGEMFEKIVTEKYGQEWKKDHVPFWESGDINTDTEKIQVKFNRATIASEKTIAKAKKAMAVA